MQFREMWDSHLEIMPDGNIQFRHCFAQNVNRMQFVSDISTEFDRSNITTKCLQTDAKKNKKSCYFLDSVYLINCLEYLWNDEILLIK